jgi:hypothetical protein
VHLLPSAAHIGWLNFDRNAIGTKGIRAIPLRPVCFRPIMDGARSPRPASVLPQYCLSTASVLPQYCLSTRLARLLRDGAHPCHICAGTGLTPAHVCTGTGLTPAHVCTGTGRTPATSARGLGSPLPHPHQDWARCCHICTGTGRTPATSKPRPPLRRRICAHFLGAPRGHAGTGLTPATSAHVTVGKRGVARSSGSSAWCHALAHAIRCLRRR